MTWRIELKFNIKHVDNGHQKRKKHASNNVPSMSTITRKSMAFTERALLSNVDTKILIK
jgi:hypothetical protein